jgi:hypothetical protein
MMHQQNVDSSLANQWVDQSNATALLEKSVTQLRQQFHRFQQDHFW